MAGKPKGRSDNTRLPSAGELDAMLGVEARRDVPATKINRHYADFKSILALLRHLDLPSELFTDQALDHSAIIERGQELVDEIVGRLSLPAAATESLGLLNGLYDYLSEEDPPQEADLIFVPGSKTQLRIDKAVELYKRDLAPLILISGGSPYYKDNRSAEAERHKDTAVTAGIPAEKILTDSRSVSLPDNVRTSLNLLDREGIAYSRIMLVNSPYVQRRGWAHFMKYVDEGVELVRVNSETKPAFGRSQWFRSETGIRVIINEFVKIRTGIPINSL